MNKRPDETGLMSAMEFFLAFIIFLGLLAWGAAAILWDWGLNLLASLS